MRIEIATLTVLIVSAAMPLRAQTATAMCPAFGPIAYQRDTAAPRRVEAAFSTLGEPFTALLRIRNGASGRPAVTSATVDLNGQVIVGPGQFQAGAPLIEVPVTALRQNVLGVRLASKPGSAFTVEILLYDATPPSISATLTPQPNSLGWNNTDVTVDYTCQDSICGIQSCPASQTISSEGLHTLAVSATDRALNSTPLSTVVKLDKTPPALLAIPDPPPNSLGWNNTNVAVDYVCQDAVSGVSVCPAPSAVTTEGQFALAATATDHAGNSGTLTTGVRLDKTAPVLVGTPAPAANVLGWNNTDVSIEYGCQDALSGVSECPVSRSVTTEGFEQLTVQTVSDRAGNTAEARNLVSVDKTPPVLTPAQIPAANAAGKNSTDVVIRYQCEDATSAVRDCPRNTYFRTEGVDMPWAVTIHDAAGNVASANGLVTIERDPSVIDGSVNPELIPDRVAYSMLFSVIYRPLANDIANEQASAAVLKAAALTNEEILLVRKAAVDLRRLIIPLDQQAAEIREREWPNPTTEVMSQLRALQQQKNATVEGFIASLPDRLGSASDRLSTFMNSVFKRRVKMVPDDPLPPGQRPGGGL